eukprot:GCRY01000764.1.p1 GENE.GCRY01000764.1~~GCRY01000764.1.p1  ORF type:complete len:234 (+),score=38.23 GCRY01000764.1:149-850(+)
MLVDLLHHEKQISGLCAVHCLNSLLQGDYFTEIELLSFANELDEKEKELNPQFTKSHNVGASGFFSVQVLIKACAVFGLSIEYAPNNEDLDVENYEAFIFNMESHWFTVRRIGLHWFNLNSMNPFPLYIRTSYLRLFLKQLQHDGFTTFVIKGQLPDFPNKQQIAALNPTDLEAESQALTAQMAVEEQCSTIASAFAAPSSSLAADGGESLDEDTEFAIALSLSAAEAENAAF